MRADSQAPIAWIERRWARPEADVAAASQARPGWRATDERRQSTPGVGPLRSRTLVAAVPAWGSLHHQEIAAPLGVAPFTRDCGILRGQRAVWGGRAHGRAVLSMHTWAAVRHHAGLKAFDARRRAVGKAPQVALTACRRTRWTILHARLQQRTPWHDNDATRA